jgi:hypothetical protein
MNRESNQYWKTADLHLAAFLFAKGGVIVGVDAHRGPPIFAFLNTPELEGLQADYKTGSPFIDVRIYVYALKSLQDKGRKARTESHESH